MYTQTAEHHGQRDHEQDVEVELLRRSPVDVMAPGGHVGPDERSRRRGRATTERTTQMVMRRHRGVLAEAAAVGVLFARAAHATTFRKPPMYPTV